MRCGREAGGRNAESMGVCPSYPENGKRCAMVAGTFCDLVNLLQKTNSADCQECPFFHSMHFDDEAKIAVMNKGKNKGRFRPNENALNKF
jgi:hypothetical protein